MAKCYFELRKQSARGTDSIAADIMRHLHTRQYLGKVVVVCDQPLPLLAASRKQWLKLTRAIQKQRSSTLNADKILKYTHTITRMQHMRFSHKTPLKDPESDVYFLEPKDCEIMPAHCYSIYLLSPLPKEVTSNMIEQIPSEGLVIDYEHHMSWSSFGLQSKVVLEQQVISEWKQMRQFLIANDVDADVLTKAEIHDIEIMDDALDILLGRSHQFLRIANEFQRALELARPLRINRERRKEYDSVVLLAYRVQALSPGTFTQHFLEAYNEDDMFFLYDGAKKLCIRGTESIEDAVLRQTRAKRHHLANALKHAYSVQ
jgi:hypothetical protein